MPTYLNEENARRMAPIFAERLSRENRGFMLLLDETHLIPDGDQPSART